MLTIAKPSFDWARNSHHETFSSMDSANSPNWLVENLVEGPLFNLGTGGNTSDVGFNPFSRRFMFIQNNTSTFREIPEADIVNGVATPTIIRANTVSGIFGSDTEGISSVRRNRSEGGYEFVLTLENGGRNYLYVIPYDKASMFTTSAINLPARQELIFTDNAEQSNNGGEGGDIHPITEELMLCQEGQDAAVRREIWLAARPADRDTDFSYTGANLNPFEPFDADAILPLGSDVSSCCFHAPTNSLVLLSDTGNAIRQYSRTGTLLSTKLLTGMLQPEGICMHGDNMVAMGETDECKYLTYVAP